MHERKSPFSAYFKILANHFHLILLTASFDLSWPKLVEDYFQSAEPIANVSDRIISIDCFLDRASKFFLLLSLCESTATLPLSSDLCHSTLTDCWHQSYHLGNNQQRRQKGNV